MSDTYELPNNVLKAVPEPVVSVCIATYQHAEFITDCVEGVLMQEAGFQWELLIGEDCSKDGTRERVFEYAEKYPDRIRVLTGDQNVKSKRNKQRLLLAARGRYIAPLDGDDYWTDPKKLQKQVHFMEENPGYSMCYHSHRTKTNEIISDYALPKEGKDFSADELIALPGDIAVATKLVRNIYANPVDADTLEYYSDYDMNIIMGTVGDCKFLPNIEPSIRRMHAGGQYTARSERDKLHIGVEMRTRAYKFFLDRDDRHRTMVALRALKSHLERRSNEIDSDTGLVHMDSERLRIAHKGAKIEFVYGPVIRKIKTLFRRA